MKINSVPFYPDWRDVGKRIRVTLSDGRSVTGILEAEEFYTGEEEVPVFYVRLGDEAKVSLEDTREWEIQAWE